MRQLFILAAIGAMTVVPTSAGRAQAVVASPDETAASGRAPDYAGARAFPMPTPKGPLPTREAAPAPALEPARLVSQGAGGGGQLKLARIAPARPALAGVNLASAAPVTGDVAPQQFGTSNHPFSTARVQLRPMATTPAQLPTSFSYPYRAAGKLFFTDGAATYVCSASLIKRGLVVTAAHCVSKFGERRFYTNFRFVPGYHNGLAPFGVWSADAHGVYIMQSYYYGVDSCAVAGVVCANDVAVIRLAPQSSPTFPGASTGWFSVGAGAWGFTPTGKTLVNQLGYPVALDLGELQERNDSQGDIDIAMAGNIVIGSLMTGGSSGGPWLNNLGERPLVGGATYGSYSTPNVVIGVTSWGYVSPAPKEQGASRFTSGNIVPLINAACGSPVSQPACQ